MSIAKFVFDLVGGSGTLQFAVDLPSALTVLASALMVLISNRAEWSVIEVSLAPLPSAVQIPNLVASHLASPVASSESSAMVSKTFAEMSLFVQIDTDSVKQQLEITVNACATAFPSLFDIFGVLSPVNRVKVECSLRGSAARDNDALASDELAAGVVALVGV